MRVAPAPPQTLVWNAKSAILVAEDHTMAKGQHVVPNKGNWSVKRAGASRASSTHSTQADAIQAATKIARNQQTEVYVHGRDGRIRERKDPGAS
jgi:uncharacterized protein YdaT